MAIRKSMGSQSWNDLGELMGKDLAEEQFRALALRVGKEFPGE
jgi:hypothetical protein